MRNQQEEEMHLPTQKRSTAVLRPFPELRWDADRLFNEMFGRPQVRVAPGGPEADFFETENEFVLEMDLPGFTSEDVDVTVEKGVLTIHGERALESEDAEGTYHLRERSWGKFSRSFSIPHTIESESVDAGFRSGVLTIKLPKAAEAKARKIEIKGE
jgi:HSP20 family protein